MLRFVIRLRRPADVGAAVLRAHALVAALDGALAATGPAAAWRGAPLDGPWSPALRDAIAEATEGVRRDMAALEAEHAAAERLVADWAERAQRTEGGRPELRAQAAARAREQAAVAAQLAAELTRLGEELAWLGALLGRGEAEIAALGA